MASRKDSVTVSREGLAVMRADEVQFQEGYVFALSRQLGPFLLAGMVLVFILWVTNQQYAQLLALDAVLGLMLISIVAFYIGRTFEANYIGTWIMLIGLLAGAFLIPLIIPSLLPAFGLMVLVFVVSGALALEAGHEILLTAIGVLGFAADVFLVQVWSDWAPRFFPEVLEGTFLLLISVGVALLAMWRAISIGRLILREQRAAVANQRQLFRTLIDNIPDYIFFKDHESRIVINNVAHAQALFGAGSPEESVGKTDFDFFPRELAQQYFADEQALMKSGEPIVDLEEPSEKPDGTRTWHLTTKIPLKDEIGQVSGLVGIARDITSRKQMQIERDELLKAERAQREKMETVLISVREVAEMLNASATEILASTTQQLASTTEQEAAVTQTVTTVEEVRSTVQQMAERAKSVSNSAQESVNVTLRGQQAVTNTVQGMQVIRERVDDIAETILMLSERTQQIGEIINSVNDIANQSKLLALNASIEAARAGEEGRGFAVVAMEVRQLAERSRQATGRVRDILQEIQQATNTAVMVTEEGSKGTDRGMQLVGEAGDAIRELAEVIEQSAQAAIQIASSTQQQTNGMDQLLGAMTSIRQATVQAAASTRQAEKSAQNLHEMARQLEAALSDLQAVS